MSVADSYEAMIADRPYRAGMGETAAREELVRCAGTQFDLRVLDAFLRALDQEEQGEDEDALEPVGAPAVIVQQA